jgi:hypothetical protein
MSVFQEVNEYVYRRLHQQLINRTTQREQKLKELMKDSVKYPAILQKKTSNRTVMYARYRFERGLIGTFSPEFHSWRKKYYQYPGSPVKNIKVRLILQTNRILARFFIHKKPPQHMLRLIEQFNK